MKGLKKFDCAVLHIGGDKTGTTSIQAFLDSERQALLSDGSLAYPPGIWHAQLASCFSSKPEECYFNSSRGITNRKLINEADKHYLGELCKWLAQVPPCQNMVLSYEGFLSLDASALARLKEFSLQWANEVKVVCYIRPPFSYAVSALSQYAKIGSFPLMVPYIQWKDIIQTYLSIFDKDFLILRKFSHDSLWGGDVVDDFMHTLGFDPLKKRFARQHVVENKSLSDIGLLLSKNIVENLINRNINFSENTYFENIGKHLESISGDSIKLSPEQVHQIINNSREDIEYLFKEFAISISEPEIECVALTEIIENNSQKFGFLKDFACFATQSIFGKTMQGDFVASELNLMSAKLDGDTQINNGSLLTFVIDFNLEVEISELEVGIHILDTRGRWAFGTNTTLLGKTLKNLSAGIYQERWIIIANLPEGEYTAGFAFDERFEKSTRRLAWYDRLCEFRIVLPEYSRQSVGYVDLPAAVTLQKSSIDMCFTSDDQRLNSIVGKRNVGGIFTTAQKGFLVFGPYVGLPSGTYKVNIHGNIGLGGLAGAWVDVVADKGQRTLLKAVLYPPELFDILSSLDVVVDHYYPDVEVRIWVEAETDLAISSITIEQCA